MFDLVPRCQVSRCPVPRFQSPHLQKLSKDLAYTIVLTFLYPYHTHSPETGVINRLRFLASQPNNAATSPCKMKHNNAKKDKIEFRKATDKSVSAQCLSCLYSSSKG